MELGEGEKRGEGGKKLWSVLLYERRRIYFQLIKEEEQSILVGPNLFNQNKFHISIYVDS